MADLKQPSPNPAGNAFVWVAIVAAAVAYVGSRANLESLRPQANEPSPIHASAKQDIDARLWQDPFGTVLQADGARYGWTTTEASTNGLKPLTRDPKQDAHYQSPLANTDAATQVIGIIVPGDSYSETVEFRRRTRYAVLAAFHVLGYSPTDAQHIGVYIPPRPQGQGANPDEGGPQFVPYEFLDPQPGGHARVLLWLDEEALGDKPLDQLARFFCNLDSPSIRNSGVRILGPEGSDTLLAMAQDAQDWNAAWGRCNPSSGGGRRATGTAHEVRSTASSGSKAPGLQVYDYSATADPLALCRQAARGGRTTRDSCLGGDWVASQFSDAGIGFMRATATDDVLARAIRAELTSRNIRPGVHGARVLLISELDTLYGRSLPLAVARCLESRSTDGSCDETGTDDTINEHAVSWLIRYSYLRGLDGQTTATPAKAAQTAGASAGTGTAADTKSAGATTGSSSPNAAGLLSETALGEGQGDYLTRMAAGLREQDAQLRNGGDEGIVAVGVLGSDVYDKLLVFEAVKSALPHALFFTTDLDERFVSPAHNVSTVNLIVASSLGLSLRHSLQQDIPPFRGSYQTTAFLATLMAACRDCASPGSTRSEAREAQVASAWFSRAATFEIGRTRPILLHAKESPSRNDCGDGAGPPDVFACSSVLPAYRLHRSSDPQVVGLFILEAIAVGVLSAFLLRFGMGRPPCLRRRLLDIARWLIPLLLGVLVLAFQLWDRGLFEHADMTLLFQGVSLWPSICIQLLSVVFGIAVIFNVGRSSEANLRRIRELLFMGPFMRNLEKNRRIQKFQWQRALPLQIRQCEHVSGPGQDPTEPTDASDDRAKEFWVRYVDYARHGVQFCRVCALTLVGLLVAWALHLVFPSPLQPVGAPTSSLCTVVALLDAITTLAVAVYIGDITLYSRLFVREAFARDSDPPLWSDDAKQEFGRQLLGDKEFDPKSKTQNRLVTTTMTLLYVSERTKCITAFIYYPFIMIALSVMSHSPVLGPLGFGPWSIAVQAMSLLVAFLSAAALRSAAEDARAETIRKLKILKWQTLTPESRNEIGGRLDLLLEYVSELREGAFSPLSQQPFVRALLLPLATYGSTLLVSLLSIAS